MIEFRIDANNLGEIKEISDQDLMTALEKCGQLWETSAKEHAPVDTGRLRNSIEHHLEGKNTVIVEPHTEYAYYVEFKQYSKKGNIPFLRPSGENNVDRFEQIIIDELKR